MRGQNTRNDIQKAWHYLLETSMGLFSDPDDVNNLKISEATSILTGFRGNAKYDNIRIGQILLPSVFPNSLMLEYIYECGITYGYLQSIKKGTWELKTQNLRAQDATINSLLRLKGKPNITQNQYDLLSSKLIKKDVRGVNEYFKGYPSRDMDPTYKLRAYWVEADFFSHGTNDFVDILNSVVR